MFSIRAVEGHLAATNDGALPRVAVVVPTHNRAAQLTRTLAALLAQDYPADRLEVLVVDNSSGDETEDVVRAAAAQAPFPVRYWRIPDRGPAVARNHGLAHTDADLIGFTDSDCRPAPGWVRAAARSLVPGVGLVAGPIRPVWPADRILGFFQHQLPATTKENYFYPTANVFYGRAVLEQMGGFDERFGTWAWGRPKGGEDTDLAWRVKRAGYAAVFAPDALVEHEATPLPPKPWLLNPLSFQVVPYLVVRIPELRQGVLWHRCLTDPANALFYLALAGVILGFRRSPLLFALAAPWLWYLRGWVRDDLAAPSRWWRIPVKYALFGEHYGLRLAVLLYASARHRALVL